MGVFFRKTIKLGPINVNLSKSGVGVSIGGKNGRIGRTAKGTSYVRGSLGGGFGYHQTISTRGPKRARAIDNAEAQASQESGMGLISTGFLMFCGFTLMFALYVIVSMIMSSSRYFH